jgi:hypothetical protein
MMNRRRGFGLIDLLILLFILVVGLGVVATVGQGGGGAAPKATTRPCKENLSMLDGATEQWALEFRKDMGSIPTQQDLLQPGGAALGQGYLRAWPVCPGGGTYTVHGVGKTPTCSLGDAGDKEHMLPSN